MQWQLRELVTLLLLVTGILGAYLVWQDFRHLFSLHTAAVENLVGRQEANVKLFTDVMARFERHSAEQNELWRRTLAELNRDWQRLLLRHDWNQGRPLEDRLPLIIEPDAEEEAAPPKRR